MKGTQLLKCSTFIKIFPITHICFLFGANINTYVRLAININTVLTEHGHCICACFSLTFCTQKSKLSRGDGWFLSNLWKIRRGRGYCFLEKMENPGR